MKYKYHTVVSHKPYGVRRKAKKGNTRKTVRYLKKEYRTVYFGPSGIRREKKEKLSRTVEGVAPYRIAR